MLEVKLSAQVLSRNIKYLRKKAGYSQEVLANKLGIKRSSIAVYESKNVEPRLRIIFELAKLFDIDISTLLQKELTDEVEYPSFSEKKSDDNNNRPDSSQDISRSISEVDESVIQGFIEKSIKIKKVLEGFRAFYNFKKEQLNNDSEDNSQEKLFLDIDNFLQLMEHLLKYNESVIQAIKNVNELNS